MFHVVPYSTQGCGIVSDLLTCFIFRYHSAGKRDRDPNPPPVACSKVAEGGREL